MIQQCQSPIGLWHCSKSYEDITFSRSGNGAIDYLAYLSPRSIAAGAEGPIAIAGDYLVVVSRLDEAIERVGLGHVREVRSTRGVYGPAPGENNYFG